MFSKQIASLSEFERLDRSSRITPCWKKAIILYKKHSVFRIFIFFLPLMIVFFATVTDYWRWGCIFLKQIQILSWFQLTRHSIDFVFVETKQFVGSNTNVILMRQTWGHRSSMSAWSKRRALAFHLSIFFCYTFLISKCRGELDLGLCTTPILAKRMPLRNGDFWLKNVFGRNFFGICQCVVVFGLQVPNLWTDLDLTLLYILILGTYGKFALKNQMLALGFCFPQTWSSAGRRFAMSRSCLHYHWRNDSFPQQQVGWDAL